MGAGKRHITLKVNGVLCELDAAVNRTLLDILRDDLGLTGTKKGCNQGECGACTVHLDGKAVNACLVLAPDADGKEIMTIEGISRNGKLHPLQQAFIDEGAVQCGYCTPGMIMLALDLLGRTPNPTEYEIRDALTGNLCRCTGYEKIRQAVSKAAADLRQARIRIIKDAIRRKDALVKTKKTPKTKKRRTGK